MIKYTNNNKKCNTMIASTDNIDIRITLNAFNYKNHTSMHSSPDNFLYSSISTSYVIKIICILVLVPVEFRRGTFNSRGVDIIEIQLILVLYQNDFL